MKIEYLFSKNNKLGSRLIAWAAKYEHLGLEDNPSHIAILINEMFVLESTLTTGVRIIPYQSWLKINTPVAKLPSGIANGKAARDILISKWGAKYDWLGLLYFALQYIKLICFKKDMDAINKWESSEKMFCTEYASLLSGQNLSMKSPARVLAEWSKNG